MLATPEGLHTFEESPLPLDPTIRVVGIHAGRWRSTLEVTLFQPGDIVKMLSHLEKTLTLLRQL